MTPHAVDSRPHVDPVDSEIQARALFHRAGWFPMTAIPEHWPLTTAEVVELLDQCGEFAIDLDQLADLINRGIIAPPAVDEDEQAEWSAIDLMNITRVLEERQQWRMTPSRHDPKKSPYAVALEQSREAGKLEELCVGDRTTPRYDARGLLLALVGCQHPHGRDMLCQLLRATLEVDHGVII